MRFDRWFCMVNISQEGSHVTVKVAAENAQNCNSTFTIRSRLIHNPDA